MKGGRDRLRKLNKIHLIKHLCGEEIASMGDEGILINSVELSFLLFAITTNNLPSYNCKLIF